MPSWVIKRWQIAAPEEKAQPVVLLKPTSNRKLAVILQPLMGNQRPEASVIVGCVGLVWID
jgi:hypothetical protein